MLAVIETLVLSEKILNFSDMKLMEVEKLKPSPKQLKINPPRQLNNEASNSSVD